MYLPLPGVSVWLSMLLCFSVSAIAWSISLTRYVVVLQCICHCLKYQFDSVCCCVSVYLPLPGVSVWLSMLLCFSVSAIAWSISLTRYVVVLQCICHYLKYQFDSVCCCVSVYLPLPRVSVWLGMLLCFSVSAIAWSISLTRYVVVFQCICHCLEYQFDSVCCCVSVHLPLPEVSVWLGMLLRFSASAIAWSISSTRYVVAFQCICHCLKYQFDSVCCCVSVYLPLPEVSVWLGMLLCFSVSAIAWSISLTRYVIVFQCICHCLKY